MYVWGEWDNNGDDDVMETTSSSVETMCTCGLFHTNTSAKAVTAQGPIAYYPSRIILQQMFSFMIFPHFKCVIVQLTDRDE